MSEAEENRIVLYLESERDRLNQRELDLAAQMAMTRAHREKIVTDLARIKGGQMPLWANTLALG